MPQQVTGILLELIFTLFCYKIHCNIFRLDLKLSVLFSQYNLDFRGLSSRSGVSGSPFREEDGGGAGSGGEGGKLGSGSGTDPSI